MRPVAPSPVKFKFGVVPHELTIPEIKHLEKSVYRSCPKSKRRRVMIVLRFTEPMVI